MRRPVSLAVACLVLALSGARGVAEDAGRLFIPLSALDAPAKILRWTADLRVDGPLLFVPGGENLLAGCARWDPETGALVKQEQTCVGAVTPDFAYSAYQGGTNYHHNILTGGLRNWDTEITVYDISNQKDRCTLKGQPKEPSELAISPDGRRVATVDSPWEDVILWDVEGCGKLKSLSGWSEYSSDHLDTLVFSPDSRWLAGANRGVHLWDAATGEHVKKIQLNAGPIAFSPDSARLAAYSAYYGDGWPTGLGVADLAAGPEAAVMLSSDRDYKALAFSPDGAILAAARGSFIELWDWKTSRRTQAIEVPEGDVKRLAFSPDGTRLAAATSKDKLYLWKDSSPRDYFAAVANDSAAAGQAQAAALESERDGKIAGLFSAKGQFETTAEYQERTRKAREEEARLKSEYESRIAEAKAAARQAVSARKEALLPFRAAPTLGDYDADREVFALSFLGLSTEVSVPRAQAPGVASSNAFTVAGKLRFFDSEKAELVDAALADASQGAKFPFGPAAPSAAGAASGPPPDLSVDSLALSDSSGEGMLRAGGQATLKVSAKNLGKGPAARVSVKVELESGPGFNGEGLAFPASTFLGDLAAGGSQEAEVPLSGAEDLKSGKARLKVTLVEGNAFDSKPRPIEFETRQFAAPKLELAKIEYTNSDGGRALQKGRQCEVALTVQNSGAGPARGVSVAIASSDPNVKIFGEARVSLGGLSPGEAKQASFSILATNRYSGPAVLPVALRLEEEREKFSAAPELALTVGAEAPEAEVVRVRAAKAPAAAEGAAGVEIPPELSDSQRAFGPDDAAVVVGIENYQQVSAKSAYSYADAKLVRSYVRALGIPDRNVEYLTDDRATLSALATAVEAWLPNHVKPGGRVFFYYSGHGAPDAVRGETYLLPSDGNPTYLKTTAYPIKRLYEKLGKLDAREVLVVLDACFSGSGGRSVMAEGERPLVTVTQAVPLAPQVAVLAATEGSQTSASSSEKGHGILTYYFLKSIQQGKKDLSEAYDWLKPQVEDEAKAIDNIAQSPTILPGPEQVKGRFLLRQ